MGQVHLDIYLFVYILTDCNYTVDIVFMCIWRHIYMKFNPMFKGRDPAWHLTVVRCSFTAAAVWLAAAAAMERS